ncbi:MAG TPA: hypothetical protein VF170_09700, partial [Planctomycetaceae bacterium]
MRFYGFVGRAPVVMPALAAVFLLPAAFWRVYRRPSARNSRRPAPRTLVGAERWIAAAVLRLAAACAASVGPPDYARARDWLPEQAL